MCIRDRLFNFINENERNDNLLFGDVSEDTMQTVINRLSQPDVINNGDLLIDFDPEEVKHIEDMITYTDNAFTYGLSLIHIYSFFFGF